MSRTIQRAFGIDQYVGDVLHVAYLVRAALDLQQRVIGRRLRIAWVEQQAVREPERQIDMLMGTATATKLLPAALFFQLLGGVGQRRLIYM